MAISLKSLFRNVKDVTTGDKDLIDRKTFLGKLDIGGLRQWDRLTGGKKSRTGQCRLHEGERTAAEHQLVVLSLHMTHPPDWDE